MTMARRRKIQGMKNKHQTKALLCRHGVKIES